MKNKVSYPWVVVGLLWFVALLNYMDRQMLSTMRTSMMVDIVELESAANFGRLMAIFLWIYGLMSPVSGIIADRISRKWLIVCSLAVWSAVTLLIGFATNYNQLYILRGIMGVSEALYLPSALSLIADYHQQKTRSLAVGIHMTGLYLGQAIGGFGATLALAYSWNQTFHWFGIIGVSYSVVLAFFLKDKERTADNVKPETAPMKKTSVLKVLAMLFSNTFFWVILLYFCVPSLPGWATKNWLPTLFSQSLSIDMSIAGPMATITIALSSFIGVIGGGILSDRWIVRNLKGRIYTGAIGLSLIIPSLAIIGFGQSLVMVISGAVLFGIGFGMFDANNMPILCQFVPSQNRATAYGIMNMAGVFAGAVITTFLGKSTDAGNLGRDFALMTVVVLIVLIIQLSFLKPKTDDMKEILK
jgi:MFS transporter, ACS family, D-galactonate transporter